MNAYDVVNAFGACLILIGGLGLLWFFGGEFREGSADAASLLGGVASAVVGAQFCILADLGKRLTRIERRQRSEPPDSEVDQLVG